MEKEISYSFHGEGLSNEEKIWGRKRLKEYRTAYPHLNKTASLHLLEELVWKEAIQERLKKQIGQLGVDASKKSDDKNKIEPIPKSLQESVDAGLEQIINLKTKLGMFEDQKQTDAFRDFISLKEKAAEYRRQHPISFKCTCPFCAKIFYLKRKTENFEEFKSPFAEDKVLNNRPLFAIYKEGRLTKEDMALILGTSPDYVDWLDEKVFGNKVEKDDAPKIDDTPTSIPPTTLEETSDQ